MQLIAPDYYNQFQCIADRCIHSCCIGWEIDIDRDTREKYRCLSGNFADRLNHSICDDDEGAHFQLDAQERCPMLNKSGLCDLITNLGEDMLCQICADHPRFRNFFSGRTEIGLGFCCEAAVQLALFRREPTRFIILSDDGAREEMPQDEETLLKQRDILIGILQNRNIPLHTRLEQVLQALGMPLPPSDWEKVYRSLEQLDDAWDARLSRLKGKDLSLPLPIYDAHAIPLEQLAVYLLFRHLPGALEDGDLAGRAAFCVLSVRVIATLCPEECSDGMLAEIVRMYSAEIEYSQQNIDTLLDEMWS
ncbi:MAG: flagellin lysine-N-methylase [Clostridia bacterium]|nr:flagellin lysine-N-methylase [Clostridia bacterium]